jgi:aspartate 1-decarboxylase
MFMDRILLKSKIHRAVVTEANLHYEGSISIDQQLMEAADLVPHERVDIYNVANGQRLQTYVIAARPGSGDIVINGAAARLVQPGDLIIIASYALFSPQEAIGHEPVVVQVDAQNRRVARSTAGAAQRTVVD